LEDALKKGLFTLDQFISFFDRRVELLDNSYHQLYSGKLIDDLKQRLDENSGGVESDMVSFQKWMELVKKWLMYVAAYRFSKSYKEILAGTYKYDLFYDTNHQATMKILKGAMAEFVYEDNEILKLELSAKKIISSLLDDFIYAVLHWDIDSETYQAGKTDKKYINIVSSNYKEDYMCARTDDEVENLYLRFLMITDFISGMTDSYAKNLYQELNGID